MIKANAVITWESSCEFSQVLNHKFYPMFELRDFDDNNWSIVVENVELLDNHVTLSKIYYLVDEAPHDRLSKDVEFNLFHGKNLIGTGRITQSVAYLDTSSQMS